MLPSALILLSLLFSAASFGQDEVKLCGPQFATLAAAPAGQRLKELSPLLAKAVEQIRAINPKIISGEKIPTWRQIDHLGAILETIRKGKIEAAKRGDEKKLEEILTELLFQVQADPKFRALTEAGGRTASIPPQGFKPTEYELKRSFQTKLWQINRELPSQIKIPGARIPFQNNSADMVAEAKSVLVRQKIEFNRLYPTTGFAQRKDLVKALKQDPQTAKIFNMVEDEKIDIVMRAPEFVRGRAARTGFHNQRVTGNSQGAFSTRIRDRSEAYLSFMEPNTYRDFSNLVKPKYGYLRPQEGQVLVADPSVAIGYGEDAYIFNKDKVRDRTSWALGDSLNIADRAFGLRPKTWSQALIPWENRELMVPMLRTGRKNKVFLPQSQEYPKSSPFWAFSEVVPEANFVEAQIWGPISLDDIEAFEFTKAPPTGDFLRELQERGIKIRDATGPKTIDWIPPSRHPSDR